MATLRIHQSVVNGVRLPLGYQKITALNEVKGFTVPTGATVAIVAVATKGVMWRDDGTNPTATDGIPLADGEKYQFELESLSVVKFIEVAASATIHVSYYA